LEKRPNQTTDLKRSVLHLQGAAKATSVQARTWDAVFNALRPSEAPLARSTSMGSTPRVAATGDGGGGGGGASTVTPHRQLSQAGKGRPSPRTVGQLPPLAASAGDRDQEVTLSAEAIALAASPYRRRNNGSSKRGWEVSVRREPGVVGGSLRDSPGGEEDDDRKPAAGSTVADLEEDDSSLSGATASSDSTGSGTGSEDSGSGKPEVTVPAGRGGLPPAKPPAGRAPAPAQTASGRKGAAAPAAAAAAAATKPRVAASAGLQLSAKRAAAAARTQQEAAAVVAAAAAAKAAALASENARLQRRAEQAEARRRAVPLVVPAIASGDGGPHGPGRPESIVVATLLAGGTRALAGGSLPVKTPKPSADKLKVVVVRTHTLVLVGCSYWHATGTARPGVLAGGVWHCVRPPLRRRRPPSFRLVSNPPVPLPHRAPLLTPLAGCHHVEACRSPVVKRRRLRWCCPWHSGGESFETAGGDLAEEGPGHSRLGCGRPRAGSHRGHGLLSKQKGEADTGVELVLDRGELGAHLCCASSPSLCFPWPFFFPLQVRFSPRTPPAARLSPSPSLPSFVATGNGSNRADPTGMVQIVQTPLEWFKSRSPSNAPIIPRAMQCCSQRPPVPVPARKKINSAPTMALGSSPYTSGTQVH
jgi:hypothetical protein